MKNTLLIIILSICSALTLNMRLVTNVINKVTVVHAEDDERESDDEKEHESRSSSSDDSSSSSSKSSSSSEPKTTTIVETVPVQKIEYRTVLDAGYDVDTDKDGLVDAIDPDPLTPQSDYYNDDDKDGIPNKFDQYPGLDDFAVQGNEDTDNNGIIDAYE